MNAIRRQTRAGIALAALAVATGLVAAVTATAHAEGLTPEQLASQGWTCFPSPAVPDRMGCFEPGLGRPFPGNPDPRTTYSFLLFRLSSGEFLGTGHLIRADLYAGQPCGRQPYVFRDRIGYFECVHA